MLYPSSYVKFGLQRTHSILPYRWFDNSEKCLQHLPMFNNNLTILVLSERSDNLIGLDFSLDVDDVLLLVKTSSSSKSGAYFLVLNQSEWRKTVITRWSSCRWHMFFESCVSPKRDFLHFYLALWKRLYIFYKRNRYGLLWMGMKVLRWAG